jgi:hypothetical protein
MPDLTKAIKIAIERGYSFNGMSMDGFSFKDHGSYIAVFNGLGDSRRYTLNDLIFSPGSDFIERLCGEEGVCRLCGTIINDIPYRYAGKEKKLELTYCKECNLKDVRIGVADYHKQQLAVMKTTGERVEYINKLTEVEG